MKSRPLLLCGLAALLLLLTLTWWAAPALAETVTPPTDPVEHGAWLYQGLCARCHGSSTEKTPPGLDLEETELRDAISGKRRGCTVRWAIVYNGPLSGAQIDVLVSFLVAWRDSGGQLDLPPLPPFPTPTPFPTATLPADAPTPQPTPTGYVETDERILLITTHNPVAAGARLYTRRCYRCHFDYGSTRIAIGMDAEKLEETIVKGKPGTSMPAFGWRNGGNLKSRDIAAVVAYITAWETLQADPALAPDLFVQPTPDPLLLRPLPTPAIQVRGGALEEGQRLFTRHCAHCHEGGTAPSLQREWHTLRADLTIRSAILQGVPGTPMQPWGERLSEDEVNSLTALIIEWSPDSVTPLSPAEESGMGWLPPLGALLLVLPALVWLAQRRK